MVFVFPCHILRCSSLVSSIAKFPGYKLWIGLRSNWIHETGKMGSDPEGSGVCNGRSDFSIRNAVLLFLLLFLFLILSDLVYMVEIKHI